jgi:hypothetical protein
VPRDLRTARAGSAWKPNHDEAGRIWVNVDRRCENDVLVQKQIADAWTRATRNRSRNGGPDRPPAVRTGGDERQSDQTSKPTSLHDVQLVPLAVSGQSTHVPDCGDGGPILAPTRADDLFSECPSEKYSVLRATVDRSDSVHWLSEEV